MQSTGIYLKKAAALLLLGLFACILAEKNTHEHTPYSMDDLNGQTMVHQPGTCLICAFQLAADADMPVLATVLLKPVSPTRYQWLPVTSVNLNTFSRPALRGPPAFLLDLYA